MPPHQPFFVGFRCPEGSSILWSLMAFWKRRWQRQASWYTWHFQSNFCLQIVHCLLFLIFLSTKKRGTELANTANTEGQNDFLVTCEGLGGLGKECRSRLLCRCLGGLSDECNNNWSRARQRFDRFLLVTRGAFDDKLCFGSTIWLYSMTLFKRWKFADCLYLFKAFLSTRKAHKKVSIFAVCRSRDSTSKYQTHCAIAPWCGGKETIPTPEHGMPMPPIPDGDDPVPGCWCLMAGKWLCHKIQGGFETILSRYFVQLPFGFTAMWVNPGKQIVTFFVSCSRERQTYPTKRWEIKVLKGC